MLNEPIAITFEDGAIASLMVPKYTVAYGLLVDEPTKIVVLTVQKHIKDESGLDALLRAEAKYPNVVWQPISGISCGVLKGGSTHQYWKAILDRTEENQLKLIIDPKDPMLGAYGFITDREAATGIGMDDIETDKWLEKLLDPNKPVPVRPNAAITKPSL